MTAPDTGAATLTELLCTTLAGLLAGAESIAIGANSPIPAAAALMVEHRQPDIVLSIQGSPRHEIFTNGGGEQFDFVARGRLEAFVLGGAQIDGSGNVNLVSTGAYERPDARYPGSFGSAFVAFHIPRLILFREGHSRRSLVDRVDFISAPGTSPPEVYRRGGPTHLLTDKALFSFDRDRGRFTLQSLHPGISLENLLAATGFDFDHDASPAMTPAPDAGDLALLRGPVRTELAGFYPKFVANWPNTPH